MRRCLPGVQDWLSCSNALRRSGAARAPHVDLRDVRVVAMRAGRRCQQCRDVAWQPHANLSFKVQHAAEFALEPGDDILLLFSSGYEIGAGVLPFLQAQPSDAARVEGRSR